MALMSPRRWFYLLLLLGVSARISGAILFSGNYSMDHSVPCLMTKHIVEGREWPVFYYGQPYMGSLESLVSALFYLLPMDKNTACNLGTAVFGMLLLPLVWYWGRGRGSDAGGLAAMALVIIGPPVYMQFMNWSYGGYAAVTFFQVALMTTAIAVIEREKKHPGGAPTWLWLLLGLSAGLGWWTSPMIIPGILAAGLLLLIQLRLRCFCPGMLYAGGAFIIGSLPLWWWNYHNEWQTLSFLQRGSGGEFRDGLAKFFPGMLHAVSGEHAPWTLVLGILVSLAVLFSTVTIIRERKTNGLGLYHLAAWLVLIMAMLFFANKPERIGPSRYFLPLIPAVAVLVGHTVVVLNRKLHRFAGWFLLLALFVDQTRILPVYAGWYQSRHAYFAELDHMRTCFESLDSKVIYSTYAHRTRGYGLNFYYREQFLFVDFPFHERQEKYSLAAELEEHPAVMNHFGKILDFIRQSGGKADTMNCAVECHLTHRFQPPPGQLAAVTNQYDIFDAVTGEAVTEALTDHNLMTAWMNSRHRRNKTLEIRFDQPAKVDAIRFVADDPFRPGSALIEVMSPGEQNWRQIADEFFTVWFWSGPRIYPKGSHYRQELRINAGEVAAIRIRFDGTDTDRYIRLAELQLFAEVNDPPVRRDDIQPLVDFLSRHTTLHVYSDRWEANQLFMKGPSTLNLSLDDVVFRTEPRRLPSRLNLIGRTALVMNPMETSGSRAVLSRLDIPFAEHTVAGWSVLVLEGDRDDMPDDSPLRWTGTGLVIDPTDGWSDEVCRLAEADMEKQQYDRAMKRIEKILAVWPTFLRALNIQHECAVRRGDREMAAQLKENIRTLSEPHHRLNVQFQNGITLSGIHAETLRVAPGGEFIYDTYWTIPAGVDPSRLAIFLHVRDQAGEIRLQGDRIFVDDRQYIRTGEETLVEKRRLTVPHNFPPGDYTLHMGLYLANPPHDQIKIQQADISFVRGQANLPFALTITSP